MVYKNYNCTSSLLKIFPNIIKHKKFVFISPILVYSVNEFNKNNNKMSLIESIKFEKK
jgi:hypothetical protein